MFQLIHGGLFKISRTAVWIGGLALMICAFMVTIDVTFRKLFGLTMSGSDEITGYVFAASTTWAYSYTLLTRANIRIDALYNILPLKPRAFLDLIALLALLYYVYLLTGTAWEMFLDNWEYNSTAQTTLATPLWIPQIFWVSGLAFFGLCLIFLTIYTIYALIQRNWALVQSIAGVKSIEEEIEEETHA